MTEVTKTDLIAEALTDYYGPHCSNFVPECHCCKAWAQFDALTARPEQAEAEKAETRKILVRCHDRIHALPRTSDTDLAIAIERLLGRLARGGSDER